MAKITILGAGITGLSIAYILSKQNPVHNITIVAPDLSGDTPSQDWASPWACAGWVALGGNALEQDLQLAALSYLRQLAVDYPESSVRCVELTDVFESGLGVEDYGSKGLWYAGRVPGFRVLDDGADGKSVRVGYRSVVLTPRVFLPWLRGSLEEVGVKFERIGEVKALEELKVVGHDVLVNASGVASRMLEDAGDREVVMDRTYVTVVRSKYQGAFVRRGDGVYTYIFGRGDGTAVVGGVSEPVVNQVRPMAEVHEDFLRRAHDNLPEW